MNLPQEFSSSLFEFIVKTLFVHLDDPQEQIYSVIEDVLKKSVRINKERFLAIATDQQNKFSHPVRCKNLIEFAQGFQQ